MEDRGPGKASLGLACPHLPGGLSPDSDDSPDRLATAIAKLYSSESVERVVSEARQIHGANGYQQGHPLESLYSLARGRRIAAGTDEIQKNNIADVVFGRGLPGTL